VDTKIDRPATQILLERKVTASLSPSIQTVKAEGKSICFKYLTPVNHPCVYCARDSCKLSLCVLALCELGFNAFFSSGAYCHWLGISRGFPLSLYWVDGAATRGKTSPATVVHHSGCCFEWSLVLRSKVRGRGSVCCVLSAKVSVI
jgi:hypothetical protein